MPIGPEEKALLPSGSSLSKGWFTVDTTALRPWVQAQQFYGQIDEKRIRQAAQRAVQPMVEAMKQRIVKGPDTNGTLHRDLDLRDVVPHIRTWNEEHNVYLGIPTENPKSDRASWMELGDEDQPPTPVLFSTIHNEELRQKATQLFHHELVVG